MTQPYNLTNVTTSYTPMDWVININALTNYLMFQAIILIIFVILLINFLNNQKVGLALLNSLWIITILNILAYFIGFVSQEFMVGSIILTLIALFYVIFVEE